MTTVSGRYYYVPNTKGGGKQMRAYLAVVGLFEATKRRVMLEEEGLSTAELLGNAALAIGALVIIWGALQIAGVNIVGWIEDQVTGG